MSDRKFTLAEIAAVVHEMQDEIYPGDTAPDEYSWQAKNILTGESGKVGEILCALVVKLKKLEPTDG
jgi:hypothetical protein